MSPRTLSLPALGAIALVLLQVPACGLNTSGALESEADDDAGAEIDAQSKGGSSGKGGGASTGGSAGAAGKSGAGGASGQAGSSGAGNSAGAAGEGGAAGAGGTTGTGGAAGATGEGGATPDGGAGATGEGGAAQDSGPDVLDAADDVIVVGVDSGPVCGLQDTAHPACNACMLEKCLPECQECATNSECVVLVNCIAACNGSSSCQKDCWDDHPSGQGGADKLGGKDGCLRDQCESECSWLPDVGGTGCSVAPSVAPDEHHDSEGWMIGALAAVGLAIAVGRRRVARIAG